RLFGPTAIHLCLEAIEVYGIRKYLALWRAHRDDSMGRSIEEVLRDEFEHEDAIVTGIDAQRMLKPEDVRSIFLGLNDGLVEILGAVSGFFAAFSEPRMVLMAGSSVAVASGEEEGPASPVRAAALVGVSYFTGALIPIFPVLLGARNLGASLLAAGSVLALVSLILAFLSGMAIRRRVLTNLLLMALAVGVTYGIGIFARRMWGISV
ncbi:MAG: VIT1/CCC1 transporter family protein, partial [Elusimicrobia bacterium]|nr:VIT1/CCC1 transporter family protein [Elusimicrobiota bacterium]